MDSFIPISSLKRDEIYSFIGGFFIASSWCMYFVSLSCNTSISDIDFVTKPFFLISWLLATALLFTIQLLLTYIITLVIRLWLKNKNQMEREKILNLQNSAENFMPTEYINDIKIGVHLIGIIIISMLLSLFPLYKLSSLFMTQNSSRLILFLIVLALIWLLYIFIKFLKMFIVIYLLKAEGLLEIMDQNTYAQERATYIANIKNKESKQKAQNYLDQQKHGE